MKVAAIYARVSTLEQSESGTSLDTQIEACKTYAHANEYAIVHVASDNISGSTLARPGLDSIRDLADRRQIEAVLFYKLDRLARDTGDTLLLLKEFRAREVEVVCTTTRLEDTPEGKFLLTLLASFAEFERSQITERTRRGKERRMREGKVFMAPHMAPYGYSYIKGEGRFDVMPEEAAWVTQIFRWLLGDHASLEEIARRLSAHNVPTKRGGSRWWASTVQGILLNETYTGVWHHNKSKGTAGRAGSGVKKNHSRRDAVEWIAVIVPAIISKEEHAAAALQLSANLRHSPRNARQFYLFRGMLVCAGCGARMKGRYNNKYNTRYYVCRDAGPGPGQCSAPYLAAHLMEDAVWRGLIHRHVAKTPVPSAPPAEKAARRGVDIELAALDRRAQALLRESTKLLDIYTTTETISKALFEERMALIRDRGLALDSIRADLEKERSADIDAQWATEQYARTVTALRTGLALTDDTPRRRFLEAMHLQLTVHRDAITVGLMNGLLPSFIIPIPTKNGRRRNKGRD